MGFKVNLVSWPKYHKEIKTIREKVFVCEYRISPKDEFDEKDANCHHVLIHDDDGTPIATGRICDQGKISRLAVVLSHRNSSAAKKVLKRLLKYAKNEGMKRVYIDCELENVADLKKHGFEPTGSVYMDSGIAKQPLSCSVERFSCEHTLLH